MRIAHILLRRRSYSNNAELQRQLAALVVRIAQRDEGSLKKFREVTVAILLSQIRTHYKVSVDEQEVLNEVYLQVWRNSARYDAARGEVITWLAVICAARVIDHFRKSEYLARGDDLCGAVDASSAVESPEDVLLASEAEMTIKAAVDGLSPMRKQLVTMAFFQELSHAEIARQTHIALGTIKSHIRRALTGMRAKMTVEEQHCVSCATKAIGASPQRCPSQDEASIHE